MLTKFFSSLILITLSLLFLQAQKADLHDDSLILSSFFNIRSSNNYRKYGFY